MSFYLKGPQLTNLVTLLPLASVQYQPYASYPKDSTFEIILGIKFDNNSPFDVVVSGFGNRNFMLRPYSEMYVPNEQEVFISPATVFYFVPAINDLLNIDVYQQSFGFVDMLIFLEGDTPPALPYVTIFRGLLASLAGAVELQVATLTVTSGLIAGGSASTTSLNFNHSSVAVGGGCWLTHISFQFGVPAASASIDVSLQDRGGAELERYHLNCGVAPMPGVRDYINFDHPLFDANDPSAGLGGFKLVVPAVAGPSYTVNLGGYSK